MIKITEKEENLMYQIINEALLGLCREKPNNPVDFLSKRMLEIIGLEGELFRKKKRFSGMEDIHLSSHVDKVSQIIRPVGRKFNLNYKIMSKLGVGSYGEVSLCEDIQMPDMKKVVKIVSKSEEHPHNLTENSVDLLLSLDHPNIVKIHEIIEDENHLYIVQDYCEGGDLFSFIVKNKILSENLVKLILKQILDGLNYLHQKGIIHRNVKPENILISGKDFTELSDIQIKLSDYGFSEMLTKRKQAGGKVAGPPFYTSPEVIEGKYNHKCDIWSVGVIAYTMLCGSPPYDGNEYEVLYKILHDDFEFSGSHSEMAKDFITGMMTKNPTCRPDVKDAMDHQFLVVDENADTQTETETGVDILSKMSKFVVGKNLKRSVLSYILSRKIYVESSNSLLKLFKEIDKDGNGQIEVAELYSSYGKFFPGTPEESWEKVKLFVERVDINNNGKLEYSEFLAVSSLINQEINQKVLLQVFDHYDKDNSGFIQASDLQEMFEGTDFSDEAFQHMIDDYDTDGDRKISFDEFYDMITKSY
jgi:calcium-dependent protein kinase